MLNTIKIYHANLLTIISGQVFLKIIINTSNVASLHSTVLKKLKNIAKILAAGKVDSWTQMSPSDHCSLLLDSMKLYSEEIFGNPGD